MELKNYHALPCQCHKLYLLLNRYSGEELVVENITKFLP